VRQRMVLQVRFRSGNQVVEVELHGGACLGLEPEITKLHHVLGIFMQKLNHLGRLSGAFYSMLRQKDPIFLTRCGLKDPIGF